MLHCASCDVAMVHTYAQKKGKPLYRYYVCGRAHRLGWTECETRSVSAPDLEAAVMQQVAEMAGDVSCLEQNGSSVAQNEVQAALLRHGARWEEMTAEGRERFFRALVKQVRYDGRSGSIILRFDREAFRKAEAFVEADGDPIPESMEEEAHGNEPIG